MVAIAIRGRHKSVTLALRGLLAAENRVERSPSERPVEQTRLTEAITTSTSPFDSYTGLRRIRNAHWYPIANSQIAAPTRSISSAPTPPASRQRRLPTTSTTRIVGPPQARVFRRFYRARPDGILELRGWMETFWRDSLSDLKVEVET